MRSAKLSSIATRVGVLLTLTVLFARALVPTGYMLDTADPAGIRIQLCSSQGFTEIVVHPATGLIWGDQGSAEGAPHQDAEPPQSCGFAISGHMAGPISNLGVQPVVYEPMTPQSAKAHLVVSGRGLLAPPPFPTGPPIIS